VSSKGKKGLSKSLKPTTYEISESTSDSNPHDDSKTSCGMSPATIGLLCLGGGLLGLALLGCGYFCIKARKANKKRQAALQALLAKTKQVEEEDEIHVQVEVLGPDGAVWARHEDSGSSRLCVNGRYV